MRVFFFILLGLSASSCRIKFQNQSPSMGGSSGLSSIDIPLPNQLSSYISSGAINGYQLNIAGGECADNRTSTSLSRFGMITNGKIQLSEKIVSGCAYRLTLSLGKSVSSQSTLEKIYLTNDVSGQETVLTKDQTTGSKIQAKITVSITDLGRSELGISGDLSDSSQQNGGTNPTPPPSGGGSCYKGDSKICAIEQFIADMTNEYRRQSGVSALTFDEKISFVARDWSNKQAQDTGSISHNGFPSVRIQVYRQEFGVDAKMFGENVAYNFCINKDERSAAKEFTDQWWNSSGHRENMLRKNFKGIGVGIYFDTRRQRCYGTQIFN